MAAGNLGPGIISLLVPGVGNFRAENVEFVRSAALGMSLAYPLQWINWPVAAITSLAIASAANFTCR